MPSLDAGVYGRSLLFTLLFALLPGVLVAQATAPKMHLQPTALSFETALTVDGATFRLSGPDGLLLERRLGEELMVDLRDDRGSALPDGLYTFELQLIPASTEAGHQRPAVDRASLVRSGYFRIDGGVAVEPAAREDRETAPSADKSGNDQSIRGSLCVGEDCNVSETFGETTLKLKEDNLRIEFDDASTGSPANDWQIKINDTDGSGSASYFAIDDLTGSTTPVVIEAGAPDNALYIDDAGLLGLGTAVPATELHISKTTNPGIRLEDTVDEDKWTMRLSQTGLAFLEGDNSSHSVLFNFGGGMQVTHDSQPILKIYPNGDFVARADTYVNSETRLYFDASEADLQIGGDLTVGSSSSGGDINYYGSLNSLSDVHCKQDFVMIDGASILERVAALPITEWAYKHHPDVRHLGPMAQDFSAAFGLGSSDRTISVTDLGSVSLVAVQELNRRLDARTAEVQELRQRLERLETLLLNSQQP